MAHRDLIVIGASAGGIDACGRLLGELRSDLDASVLVVMHLSPESPGQLPAILRKRSALPVSAARDGEVIQPGHVYVGVPDRHLVIEGERLRLTRGPKECRARPAVDTLFRSAAYYHGGRVIGIVLTGRLDDGTAGLWAIKDRGGLAIVQDPAEAPYPSMPESALRHVDVDYTLTIAQIAEQLPRLIDHRPEPRESLPMNHDPLEAEVRIALDDAALGIGAFGLGTPSHFTCPECHGSMVEIKEGSIKRFRCHTGHAYSERSLAAEWPMEVEKTLISALAQLEEYYLVLRRLQVESNSAESAATEDAYRQRAERILKLIREARELTQEAGSNAESRVESAA